MCLFLDLEFKHDKDLMAVAADAITNGFVAVFGCTQHRGEPHRLSNNIRPKCATFKTRHVQMKRMPLVQLMV